jgi:hypothetical protein
MSFRDNQHESERNVLAAKVIVILAFETTPRVAVRLSFSFNYSNEFCLTAATGRKWKSLRFSPPNGLFPFEN